MPQEEVTSYFSNLSQATHARSGAAAPETFKLEKGELPYSLHIHTDSFLLINS